MFTGLIEEIGHISSLENRGNGRVLTVNCSKILEDIHIDDSIAIQGVCQTVVAFTQHTFTVIAIEETLKKTTFSDLTIGMSVNLERAMLPTTRLGGHIVQGHVDTVGYVDSVRQLSTSWEIWIRFPQEFRSFIIPVGSICINGISLTVAEVTDQALKVAIIPHTWDSTTISKLSVGTKVNLEFDVIGKYIFSMMNTTYLGNMSGPNKLTPEKLQSMGY